MVAISISLATDLTLAVGRGQRDTLRSSVKVAQLKRGLQEEQSLVLPYEGVPGSTIPCTDADPETRASEALAAILE